MSDPRSLLERESRRFIQPDGAFERLVRRRDRKRRNQRIAAGLVGIAVFVAAIWIVTAGGAFDRTQTPAVPGPAETGPLTGYTGDPFSVGFDGLPPESATPSEPFRGKLVFGGISCEGCGRRVIDFSTNPARAYIINVYADGRLIWARVLSPSGCCRVSAWIEQRLTPEGVELLHSGGLSGAIPLVGSENPGERLPASAWEDVELRPYVPQRYAILSGALGVFPAAAQDLLRGTEGRVFTQPWQGEEELECFEVTIDDARALAEILGDAGFEGPEFEEGSPGGLVWDSPDGERIQFEPILPDGTIVDRLAG